MFSVEKSDSGGWSKSSFLNLNYFRVFTTIGRHGSRNEQQSSVQHGSVQQVLYNMVVYNMVLSSIALHDYSRLLGVLLFLFSKLLGSTAEVMAKNMFCDLLSDICRRGA